MNWPATLPPYPQREGLEFAGGQNVLETPVDRGPSKRRRTSTLTPDQAVFTYFLTETQRGVWEEFLEDDLAGGVLRFAIPDPRGADLSDTLSAALVGGKRGARLMAGPGAYWTLTLQLEVV